MEALKDARNHQITTSADWIWIADVDEFLNIRTGNGTIPELIEASENPHAISLTFQFFANDDIHDFVDEPVISQFMHSHNPDIWCDQLAIEVKTLIRNDFPLHYYGAHRPFFRQKLPKERYPVWKDGSGRNVPHKFLIAENKRRIRRFPAAGSRNLATLNHYALRSMDSYLVKNARGDVNRENRNFDDTYWRERNDDSYYDDSILRYLPRLETEIAALKSLPKIAKLHKHTVATHRQKLQDLMEDRAYANLRAQLIAASKMPPQEDALLERLSNELSM
jgi:hypothetical protein